MDFSSLGSIMYCRTCEEYTVINVDEKNPRITNALDAISNFYQF